MHYRIERLAGSSANGLSFTDERWQAANTLMVNQFHPRSSDHRPTTVGRLLYDNDHIHVLFEVGDRYVRCVRDTYQEFVSKDSCVEFFLQPRPEFGYFNFEINCGGTMLLYYIEDPTRASPALFRKYRPVTAEEASGIQIRSSLPIRVEPEITTPVDWSLSCSVPLAFFEPFVGHLGPISGQTWRGNFFKCGDETSHPHWASWSPIGEQLRFHQPQYFAPIQFT